MKSDDVVLEVKRATDLVALVESYFPLQKSGSRFKARCPFHEEKTPSFYVNPVEQFFKCFGCQKGGDAFSFVMEMEKVPFPEALRILAEKANIQLRAASPGEREAADLREEIYRTNRWAATLFHKKLLEGEEGAEARGYVGRRGISGPMVSRFYLGYAPRSYEWLLDQGRVKGISPELLERSGLVLRNDRGAYSRFRNRLMFPIFDVRDRVVGFGARALDPEDEPKYLNSPETPVFRKKEQLYGLNLARQAAQKSGQLGIVEGYTDVIASHQHGYEWVVATLGTALASEHVKQLKRFAHRVIAVYDGDAAGVKASERSLDFFLNEDVEFRIATLPGGYDPADCFEKLGTAPFEKAAAEARELFEFRLHLARGRHDVATAKGAAAAAEEIISSLALVDNEVLREAQIRRMAEVFGLPENAIRKELSKKVQRPARAVAAAAKAAPPPAASPEADADVRAGRELLQLMLLEDRWLREVRSAVRIEDFPSHQSRTVGAIILDLHDRTETARPDAVLARVAGDPALASWVADVLDEASRKQGNPENRWKAVSEYLQIRRWEAERRRLEEERAECRRKGDAEGEGRAFEGLARLQRERSGGDRSRRAW
ncbi:MAG: DNA primase [Candidatus Brocadiae bacterium]|nr:DNA primase [Candidatus Brocadiia bacterium]